jgi:hypothetical protein
MQAAAVLAAGRQRPTHKAAQKQQIRQVIMLGMAAIVGISLVLAVVFGIRAMQGPEKPLLGKDPEVKKEMTRVTYEEARSWLSQGHDRVLMGHSPAESQRLIEHLYSMTPSVATTAARPAARTPPSPSTSTTRVSAPVWRNTEAVPATGPA